MKNYMGFVNDHSGSMSSLANAAIADYNATITAVKDAASREMLDTVVSVIGIGIGNSGYGCERQVVISNPHVLKPVTKWSTDGGTPLYDGVGDMIELFKGLPDYSNPNVSFLVMTTTDGQEAHSNKYTSATLSKEIKTLQDSGRWTFVFRVPKGYAYTIKPLGVPLDNIQEWGTSAQDIEKSTAATTQAMDTFFATRSAGAKASTVFYANAAGVDAAAIKANLVDVSKDVKLVVVPDSCNGSEIKSFCEQYITGVAKEFLKGAAFYQLTKTEARVQADKLIVIRDKTTGKMYSGSEARTLIGLPTTGNARLHPGDHGNYDLFIQSTSVNRKLVAGTGVLYWEKIGQKFTDADLAYLQPKVVQLPVVPVSTKPTPSPLKPTPKQVTNVDYLGGKLVEYFDTRSQARASGKTPQDAMRMGLMRVGMATAKKRWFVYK